MTGWRVGFTVAPKPVVEAMATLQGQSTTHAAAVAQAAALAAIEGPTDELETMRVEFDKRRKAMVKAPARDPRRQVRRAEGRVLRVPRPVGVHRQEDARGQEDRERRPAVRVPDRGARAWRSSPGSAFGAPGFVRLSYATSMKNVEEGVQADGRGAAQADVASVGSRKACPLPNPPPGRTAGEGIG